MIFLPSSLPIEEIGLGAITLVRQLGFLGGDFPNPQLPRRPDPVMAVDEMLPTVDPDVSDGLIRVVEETPTPNACLEGCHLPGRLADLVRRDQLGRIDSSCARAGRGRIGTSTIIARVVVHEDSASATDETRVICPDFDASRSDRTAATHDLRRPLHLG
jgi:hypothetical protein